MKKNFIQNITPFIWNLNHKDSDPMEKEIKENGVNDTIGIDVVNVEIEGGSGEELTPEAQEQILQEELF